MTATPANRFPAGTRVRVVYPGSPLDGCEGTVVRAPRAHLTRVEDTHAFVDVPDWAGEPFLFAHADLRRARAQGVDAVINPYAADDDRVWVALKRGGEGGLAAGPFVSRAEVERVMLTDDLDDVYPACYYRDQFEREYAAIARRANSEPEPAPLPFVEYRVTFGTAHARLPGLPRSTPDGWLSVEAPVGPDAEFTARAMVIEQVGRRWSSIYHPDEPHYPGLGHYPLGEIDRLGHPADPRPSDRCGSCWHGRSSHNADWTGCYQCPDSGPYPCRGMRGRPFLRAVTR